MCDCFVRFVLVFANALVMVHFDLFSPENQTFFKGWAFFGALFEQLGMVGGMCSLLPYGSGICFCAFICFLMFPSFPFYIFLQFDISELEDWIHAPSSGLCCATFLTLTLFCF